MQKKSNINYSAIIKTIIVLLFIISATIMNFPLIRFLGDWFEGLAYYSNHNQEWIWLGEEKQFLFMAIPFMYLFPLPFWYVFFRKPRRKQLIINGKVEGTVVFIRGMNLNSHFYDLYCIFSSNPFRHRDWDDITLPISKNFYNGKIVVYYKTHWFEWPSEWKKYVIINSNKIHVSLFGVRLYGKYNKIIKHPINDSLTYIILFNKIKDLDDYNIGIYPDEKIALEPFRDYHRRTLERIRRDNTEIMLGNPALAEKMLDDSMMFISEDLESEILDLIPEDELEPFIRRENGPGIID